MLVIVERLQGLCPQRGGNIQLRQHGFHIAFYFTRGVWWCTWWLLRVGNRTLYALSKEPTFEILGGLGGAVEVKGPKRARLSDAVNKLRSVLPLLRPKAAGATSASSGDEADSETPAKQPRRRATIQDTDYESHFEGVHGNPWIEKLPSIRRHSTAS